MFGIIIAIILSILSIFRPKSMILSILLLILMMLLWGWNTYNGDYKPYETSYYIIPSTPSYPMEFGYKAIVTIANEYGLTYSQFLKIFAVICICLLSYIVFSLTEYKAICLALYFWIYFPLDYVLLRNTLSFLIIGCAFVYFFKQKKNRIFIVALLILIASSIHSTSVFYTLLFLFLLLPKIKLRILMPIMFLAVVLIFIAQQFLFSIFDAQFGERASFYDGSFNSFLIYTFWQIIMFLILTSKSKVYSTNIQYDLIKRTNIFLFILSPLFLILSIVVRIFRNCSFISSIYIIDRIMKHRLSILYIILFLAFNIFFYTHFIGLVSDDTITPLFFSNELLS